MFPENQPTPAAQVPPPPAPAAPAPPPAPSVPPPPAATPSPAAGSGSTGAAAGSGAGSPTPGVPEPTPAAPQYTPEQVAQWRRQAEEYQQYQPYVNLGYQTYQHQLRQQAQPAQPAQPAAEPPHPWGLPRFDMALLDMVERDPASGQLRNRMGAPPDAAYRVQQYQESLRKAQQDLFNDPRKALEPIVKQIAAEVAKQQYQEQFGGYQQQQAAQQILQQNESWLYERGQDGQAVTQFNPATGQAAPKLSPWGQFYAQQIQLAERQGIRDPQVQNEFAIRAVKAAAYEAEVRRAQAGQQGQQQQAAFLQQAAANAAAGQPPAPAAGPLPPAPGSLTLRERLHRDLNANGITDQTLMNQVNRLG